MNILWTGLSLLVVMFLLRVMRGILVGDGKSGETHDKIIGRTYEDNYDEAEHYYKDLMGLLDSGKSKSVISMKEIDARAAAYYYLKQLDGGEIKEEHVQRWRDKNWQKAMDEYEMYTNPKPPQEVEQDMRVCWDPIILQDSVARIETWLYLRDLDGGIIIEEHRQKWIEKFGGEGPLGDLDDEESLGWLEHYRKRLFPDADADEDTVKAAVDAAGQSETHELHEVDYYA